MSNPYPDYKRNTITLPVAKQPAQQEPVATVTSESGNPNVSMSWWHEPALPVGTKLYTSPPAQRKPLTDEEIMNLCASEWASHPIEVARIIEAAHGITGEQHG